MKLTTYLLSLCLSSLVAASAFDKQKVLTTDDNKLSVPGENPLNFCEDPKDDILTIKNVDLSPNPPKAGEVLTIEAKGNFTEKIEEGAFMYLTVKLGLIRIIYMKRDLCDTMKNVDQECPIEKGETTITKEVELPKAIPPGKYTVHADVYTKDEKKITCLDAAVVFSR